VFFYDDGIAKAVSCSSSSRSIWDLIPTNFLPCSTRNRPIHANSLNKLFEAVVNDKPGIKFAYGDNAQVFDLLAKDPVSSCAMLMSHKVSVMSDWKQYLYLLAEVLLHAFACAQLILPLQVSKLSLLLLMLYFHDHLHNCCLHSSFCSLLCSTMFALMVLFIGLCMRFLFVQQVVVLRGLQFHCIIVVLDSASIVIVIVITKGMPVDCPFHALMHKP
jgi:hypothetical protein